MIASQMAQLPPHRPERASIEAVSEMGAAELMQVSRPTVQRARRVAREAPKLIEPIKRGEMTVNATARPPRPRAAARPRRTLAAWTSAPPSGRANFDSNASCGAFV